MYSSRHHMTTFSERMYAPPPRPLNSTWNYLSTCEGNNSIHLFVKFRINMSSHFWDNSCGIQPDRSICDELPDIPSGASIRPDADACEYAILHIRRYAPMGMFMRIRLMRRIRPPAEKIGYEKVTQINTLIWKKRKWNPRNGGFFFESASRLPVPPLYYLGRGQPDHRGI